MTVTKEMLMAYDRVFVGAGATLPPSGVSVAAITAALSAQQAPAVPDGWKLVPVEPTDDMLRADPGTATTRRETWNAALYRAMLAAAPQPAPQPVATAISRSLMGKIIDEVFDGALEDASVIEDIYRVIVREHPALTTKPAEQQENERLRQDGRTKELALGNLIDIWKLRADAAEARMKALEGLLETAEDLVLTSIKRMRAGHVACLDLQNMAEEFIRSKRAALKGGAI